MNMLVQTLSSFFIYAVVAIFAQNAVFSRALGVSRLVKLVDDGATGSLLFCACMCAVQLISAPLAFLCNKFLLAPVEWRAMLRPLVMLLCSAAGLGIVLVAVTLLKLSAANKVARMLPMATFNCAVLGCLFLTTGQNFTFVQTMGFALGSAAGYTFALLAVTEAQRKLKNRSVPNTFQGLPVTLLYIAVLALAIYGFTGHMVAF